MTVFAQRVVQFALQLVQGLRRQRLLAPQLVEAFAEELVRVRRRCGTTEGLISWRCCRLMFCNRQLQCGVLTAGGLQVSIDVSVNRERAAAFNDARGDDHPRSNGERQHSIICPAARPPSLHTVRLERDRAPCGRRTAAAAPPHPAQEPFDALQPHTRAQPACLTRTRTLTLTLTPRACPGTRRSRTR